MTINGLSFWKKFVGILILTIIALMFIKFVGWFVIFLKDIFFWSIGIALVGTFVLHFKHKINWNNRKN